MHGARELAVREAEPVVQLLGDLNRVGLPNGIARVLFTTGERRMILLHGFIKKSAKTPKDDLALAKTRLRLL